MAVGGVVSTRYEELASMSWKSMGYIISLTPHRRTRRLYGASS